MCGITGIFSFNLVGQVYMINLANSTKSLASRGPDVQNTYHNTFVGMGHRRLSIIDTSQAANQPMYDPSGKYVLIYNGEIYNYLDLKKELEESGVAFQTHSDTEVLLHYLIKHGEAGLPQLNGFFSFCLYNIEEDEMLLAIDPMGIKPLYWMLDENKFLFASEMKALFEYGLEKPIDPTALHVYSQLNYIPAPFTALKDVKKLQPGHYIKINRNSFENKPWTPPLPSLPSGKSADPVKRFREILEDSVKKRLVADVPLGCFLSGGIDSSLIALQAKKWKEDIHTFSVGFEEAYFNETNYAESVAKMIGSTHNTFIITEEMFKGELKNILDYIDEPFADSSAIAYYMLSKETRKHVTVALSGDGADELFGGYNKHLGFMKSISGSGINTAMKVLSPFLSVLPGSRDSSGFNKIRQIKKYASLLKLGGKDRYWKLAGFQEEKQVSRWLTPSQIEKVNREEYLNFKQEILTEIDDTNPSLQQFLATDSRMVLPGDMLVKADRMSMANSLEVRVPFLDPEMVTFAFSLSDEWKIRENERKWLLYEAFKEELPQELYHRPKKGFEVPLKKWLKNSIDGDVLAPLFDPTFINEQGIFQPKRVQRVRKKLKSMNPGDSHAIIWAYIVFQWWYKKYFSPSLAPNS